MARLVPNDIDGALTASHQHAGELATLLQLRDGLSEEYVVYHAVHWAQAQTNGSVYGEIDFIVANRYGKLLAIEQKDTHVFSDAGDLKVSYRHQPSKSVTTQVSRNLNALRREFAKRHGQVNLTVEHLLYLPNTIVQSPMPAGVDPQRVIDARASQTLSEVIEALFDAAPMPDRTPMADPLDIHQFLSDRVDAAPHIGLLGKNARSRTSRMAGGLATWAARLHVSPDRLRVTGTAGSGKTQLALQELHQAHRQHQAALYVCYNRPLADALKLNAPDPGVIVTAHELGQQLGLQAGVNFDFEQPDVFDRMIEALHVTAPQIGPTFDLLIIDESQDMQAQWISSLLLMVKPAGRVLLLEDPAQRLYERTGFDASDWPRLDSPVNYRSPHKLVHFMNALALTEHMVEPGSSIEGFDPGWHYYDDHTSLIDETENAINQLITTGYDPANIAILTYCSARHSALQDPSLNGLGGLALRRLTGYQPDGTQTYSCGALLVESVRRFKGQAADAVVITEVDFEQLDELAKRMLFVALTRARLHAVLVTSKRARDALLACLQA